MAAQERLDFYQYTVIGSAVDLAVNDLVSGDAPGTVDVDELTYQVYRAFVKVRRLLWRGRPQIVLLPGVCRFHAHDWGFLPWGQAMEGALQASTDRPIATVTVRFPWLMQRHQHEAPWAVALWRHGALARCLQCYSASCCVPPTPL